MPDLFRSPNGLGRIEAEALTALLDLGGTPGSPVRTTRLLEAIAERTSIHPAWSYPAVLALARPWSVAIPLFDPRGNFGTRIDPPADPRYTEAELSATGLAAALAEQGRRPGLPLGLILGDHHAGGTTPPFSPSGVVDALLRQFDNPDIDDTDLHGSLGLPTFACGSEVSGPIDRLLAGERVRLVLSTRIEKPEPGVLRLTGFPPSESRVDIHERLVQRRAEIGIRELRDESQGIDTVWFVRLATGIDPMEASERILSTWPLRVEVEAELPTCWRDMAADWLMEVGAIDLGSHLRQLTRHS